MRRSDRDIYGWQAGILKALAHPARVHIVSLLRSREVSCSELLSTLGVSKANLSQHLAVLRKSRIVLDRRDGVYTYYRLAYSGIATACDAVRNVLARQLREMGKQAKVLSRAG